MDLVVNMLNRINGTTILLTLSGPAIALSMQVEMSLRGHQNGSRWSYICSQPSHFSIAVNVA